MALSSNRPYMKYDYTPAPLPANQGYFDDAESGESRYEPAPDEFPVTGAVSGAVAKPVSDWTLSGLESLLGGGEAVGSEPVLPGLSELLSTGSVSPLEVGGQWGYTSATTGAPVSMASGVAGAPAFSTLAPLAAIAFALNRASNMTSSLSKPGQGVMEGLSEGMKPMNLLAFMGTSPLIGAGLGLFNQMFGSSKDEDQVKRDQGRNLLQSAGLLSDDFSIKNADGTTFNGGLDGGATLQNADGTRGRPYDVDFNDKRSGDVVASLDPLMDSLFAGDEKMRSDMVGQFTRAALSEGDPFSNVRAYYQQAGYAPQALYDRLLQQKTAGLIDPARFETYMHSLNRLWGYK